MSDTQRLRRGESAGKSLPVLTRRALPPKHFETHHVLHFFTSLQWPDDLSPKGLGHKRKRPGSWQTSADEGHLGCWQDREQDLPHWRCAARACVLEKMLPTTGAAPGFTTHTVTLLARSGGRLVLADHWRRSSPRVAPELPRHMTHPRDAHS